MKTVYSKQFNKEISDRSEDLSISIVTIPNCEYMLNGNVTLKETQHKSLLLKIDINNENTKEFILKNPSFMLSKKEGVCRYINPDSNGNFGIIIQLPDNIKSFTLSLKRWNSSYALLNHLLIKNSISYKVVKLESVDDFQPIYEEPVIYQLVIDDTLFEFLANFRHHNKLLVLGTSGIKESQRPPVFQRHTQIDEFPFSTIIFHDPTLYIDDSIKIGWYLGNEKSYFFEKVQQVLDKIVSRVNFMHKDIIFYGSSASGYFSLKMATSFQDSIAVITNSQTNILEYHEDVVQKLLEKTYPNIKVIDSISERLSIMKFIKKENYFPKVFYRQNILDGFHYRKHFLPFLDFYKDFVSNERKLHIELYSDKKGHNAVASDAKNVLKEVEHALFVFDMKEEKINEQ